jgi:hypothetical protein
LAISLTMNNPSPTLRPTDATSVPRTFGWNNVGYSAAGMTDPWLCTAIENTPGAIPDATVSSQANAASTAATLSPISATA